MNRIHTSAANHLFWQLPSWSKSNWGQIGFHLPDLIYLFLQALVLLSGFIIMLLLQFEIAPSFTASLKNLFGWPGADGLASSMSTSIDLLPLPLSCQYNLSWLEWEAIQYIGESLVNWSDLSFIFPRGSGLFFVQKKFGSLWQCIDYRSLNNITAKNKYLLQASPGYCF